MPSLYTHSLLLSFLLVTFVSSMKTRKITLNFYTNLAQKFNDSYDLRFWASGQNTVAHLVQIVCIACLVVALPLQCVVMRSVVLRAKFWKDVGCKGEMVFKREIGGKWRYEFMLVCIILRFTSKLYACLRSFGEKQHHFFGTGLR